MELITKDHQQYNCSFILFEENIVILSLWDVETKVEIAISDIDYISQK